MAGGAVFNQEQGAIQVRRGMDAADIFRSVSLELCHVDLELQTSGYSRSEDGYKAYCASYLLCKKYGVDVRSYDLSGIQGVLAGKEPREIAGELSDIKETASAISARMSRALEQNRQSKLKNRSANVWRKKKKEASLWINMSMVWSSTALNKIRNDLLEEQRPTDIVDEVLLKPLMPLKKGTEPE